MVLPPKEQDTPDSLKKRLVVPKATRGKPENHSEQLKHRQVDVLLGEIQQALLDTLH